MKKRLLALLMAMALCVGLAACGQKDPDPTPEAGGTLTAGTYTASKLGMNGQVKVEVVVDETTIQSVKVLENQETPGIGSPLVDGEQEGTIPTLSIPKAIVDNQTVNVDAVAGATIAFVGDFQRMVYLAIHGELFEGVVNTTSVEGGTRYEVVTQGYGGEMETYVTIDGEGRITAISVRDHQETAELGGKLVEADSDFIQALIAGQDNVEGVDAVAGATVTSEAMKKAVRLAQEAGKA